MMTAQVHLNKALESCIYLTKRPFYSPHILRPSGPQVDFQNVTRYRTLQGYLKCYSMGAIVSFKSVFYVFVSGFFYFLLLAGALFKSTRCALCCRSEL